MLSRKACQLLGTRGGLRKAGAAVAAVGSLFAAGSVVGNDATVEAAPPSPPQLFLRPRAQTQKRRNSLEGCYAINQHDLIGVGSLGRVSQGTDKETGEQVAIKTVKRDSTSEENIAGEVDVMQEVGKHPHIVGLKGVYADDMGWHIVMELAQGGELYERLVNEGMLSEGDSRCVMKQIASAAAHLHEKGIVHLDIKPENIMLAHSSVGAPSVMLTDFGSAFRVREGSPECKHYTAAYSPPEVIRGDNISEKADVWALGVIMYILLRGVHPFDPTSDLEEEDIVDLVLNSEPNFEGEGWEEARRDAVELTKRCLAKDPSKRPDAIQVLLHPWVLGS